jgi:hypothetical protein
LGTHWQSAHGEVQVDTFRIAGPGITLASVFEQQKKEPADRKPDYNVLRPDFFVVSGLQGLKKFYVRGQGRDNDVRGVTVLYDQAMEGTVDRIAVAMSSAFVAFPTQVAGPAPRSQVEYGTGLVVSAEGDIVTDADLVTGCEVIAVPGLGNAERVADDNAVLGLVRVNGARDLAPVALAVGGAPGGDVTLVGIADPRLQNGGHAVSTARGRIVIANGTAAVEPAPPAGFAGSPALDRDGNLTGVVDFRPSGPAASGAAVSQAGLVAARTITTFLEAQKVTPATGHAGLDNAKAAVVRVICVRK